MLKRNQKNWKVVYVERKDGQLYVAAKGLTKREARKVQRAMRWSSYSNVVSSFVRYEPAP